MRYRFKDPEKKIIRVAIAQRRSIWQDDKYKKILIELDNIEDELLHEVSELSRMNKSLIIGCLRDTYHKPNKEIRGLKDYQLFFKEDDIQSKLLFLDDALNLLNKLTKVPKDKCRLRASSISIIRAMMKSNKILYSKSINEKIYKAAILTDNQKGIQFDLDQNHEFGNFTLLELNEQTFTHSATASIVKQQLIEFSRNNELTIAQSSFVKMLQKICSK